MQVGLARAVASGDVLCRLVHMVACLDLLPIGPVEVVIMDFFGACLCAPRASAGPTPASVLHDVGVTAWRVDVVEYVPKRSAIGSAVAGGRAGGGRAGGCHCW